MSSFIDEAQRDAASDTLRHVLVEVAASIAGSVACVYTGQPLDTVKVRLQAKPLAYRSALHCLTKTVKQESLSSLWKGSTPALAGAVAENAVAFVLNTQLKRIWPPSQQYPHAQPLLYGGVTGALAAFALCPFDVVKCKVQVARGGPLGRALNAKEMAVHIAESHGLQGFYRGLAPQIVRDTLFFSMFFGIYELALQRAERYESIPKEVSYVCAGGIAGVAGWVVSMPADTVKSVIQTSASHPAKGMVAVASKIVAAQGYSKLFAGLGVAVVRAFPANASLFLGYELAKRNL